MNEKIKIMIVDDEAIVGTRLKASLEKNDFQVQTFTSSEEAVDCLAQNKFDIVVTDLKMPNIDGMQLFYTVKEQYPATKVIMVSGFATIEIAKEAMSKGVFEFIVKPFKISQLKEIIRNAVDEIKII